MADAKEKPQKGSEVDEKDTRRREDVKGMSRRESLGGENDMLRRGEVMGMSRRESLGGENDMLRRGEVMGMSRRESLGGENSILRRGGVAGDKSHWANIRREQLKHDMANPEYLSRKAAIDTQHSLTKTRWGRRGMGGVPRQQNNPLNQLSDDVLKAAWEERQSSMNKFRGKLQRKDTLLHNQQDSFDQIHNEVVEAEGRDDRQGKVGWRGKMNILDKMSAAKKRKALLERRAIDNRFDGLEKETLKVDTGRKIRDNSHSRISVLGTFDVESYLSAQRMVEGEGDAMKNFQFNQVASDATPPNRHLRDFRHNNCQSSYNQYMDNLPSTTVIICFTNEARSALLRTIVR